MPNGTNEKVFDIKVNYNDAINKIAELKGRLQDVTTAQKGFAQSLKDGSITQEEYNKAMAASKIAGDSYKSSIRDIEKAVKNQIKTEKEQEGSLKQLRAELSNATAAYDGMGRAERDSAKGKELQKHINEITTELKNAEEATQRYYRNVGNYENAIKNALGINSKWANSLIALGKEIQSAGGFMNMARTQVEAFSKSMSGLLTNPIFLAIAGIAGAGVAFKWWVDYNSGLQEATKLTQEFTGKEGEEMQHFRNEVISVADTFDKDFKEVLNSADGLAAQFGITVDEAMDIIKDGFVAGADEQGTFLENLQKFPAAFQQAGLSADQFTAIVAQTKSGIFDEAGLAAIQQADIRIRQMSSSTASSLEAIGIDANKVTEDLTNGSRTTFDVLQEVSSRLATMPPQSQEVANALTDVFGKQGRNAGLQMIETLADMSTDLDEVKEKTGELGSLQEQEMQANIDLQNAMSDVFDLTGGTFETLKTSVTVFCKEGLATLLGYVKDAIQYVKDLYNESTVFRTVIESISTVFRQIWNVVKTVFGLITNTVGSVAKLIKGIFTLDWNTIKQAFTDGLNGIFDGIKNFVNNGIKEVGRLFGIIKKGNDEVAKVSKQAAQASKSSTSSSSTAVVEAEAEETVTSTATRSGRSSSRGSSLEDTYSKELQLVRQAEDDMIKVIRDSRLQQQLTIEKSYNRQIEDLQRQLTTEKNLTETGREAINTRIRVLEQQKNDDLDKLGEDELQNELKQQERLLQLRLENAQKDSEEEYALRQQLLAIQRDETLADETLTQEMRDEILKKYNSDREELIREQQMNDQQVALDAIEAYYATLFEAVGNNELARTQLMLEMAQERRDALYQLEGESDEAFLARYTEAQGAVEKAQKKSADIQVKVEKEKATAIGQALGSMSNLMNAFAEDNKAAAIASKVLALGQIAVATGVALADGIKQAQSVPFPGNIAAIATTVATILANITNAISTVNSASFAEGGLVTGAGSGTSDSIPARLSNGESVITARATQMFAPLLSSINQIGGGVPINVAGVGSDMLADDVISEDFTESLQTIQPIVTVEDINRVSNRVQVAQTRGAW